MSLDVLDQAKSEAFAQKLTDVINGAAMGLMTSLGHRTGLFDVMSRMAPAPTHEIARRAGLSERYVREWLGAMVTGGFVEYDPEEQTYRLPPEHAAWLTRAASPNNMAVSTQWISVLASAEDRLVEAFRHGRGVPYEAYHRFHEVMAEESGQTVVSALEQHLLPLIPDVVQRLEQGIDVLDIGCGSGMAICRLAEMFPNSRFIGYDMSKEAIEAARAHAARRELNNVRFAVKDLAQMDDRRQFDLITSFDVIHDQARPEQVLRNVRAALRPGATFFMQDILASSHLHHNHDHPVGPFIYTVSCMHCMSVSLANGGPGLGAAWGKELALAMLADAGFQDVRVEQLPHDAINYYYIMTLPS